VRVRSICPAQPLINHTRREHEQEKVYPLFIHLSSTSHFLSSSVMSDSLSVPGLQGVSAHAWNGDRSLIALSPNTNEVWIYATNGATDTPQKWEKKYVLDEHAGQVSGMDWCAATNQLVTCGHDRNAYVWNFDQENNKWKPTLVILRINRAATAVKWSPAGNKFAVASGAKCVPICQFDAQSNWWISKMIKKHKSTVLSVAWCINNKFLATGSSDMKCRIFSAYIDGLDSPEDDGFGEVFPKQHDFGEVLAEFDQGRGWIHSVAWAPGGFRVAFGSHGSTLNFVQLLAGSAPIVQTINCRDLPYLDLQFLNDNALVGAGWEANIDLYTVQGGSDAEPQWKFKEKVDKKKSAAAATPSSKPVSAGFAASRSLFQKSDSTGVAFGSQAAKTEVQTKHKNTIVNLQLWQDDAGNVTHFTTAGLDGRVCVWAAKDLSL